MFALLACLVLPLAQSTDEGPTLEEVLVELRATRDRVLAELQPRVADAMARLESLGAPRPRAAYERVHGELLELGPRAVPLYVPFLDPGEDPEGPALFRASEVADLLTALPLASVVPDLVELVAAGSPTGRVLAARALGHAPLGPRVRDALRAAWESEDAELRGAALGALARLGDPESVDLVRGALAGDDGTLVGIALEALVDVRACAFAPDVRALAGRHRSAGPHAATLLAFFRACPEAFDDEAALALLGLVKSRRPKLEARVAVLRGLQRMDLRTTADIKGALDEIASGSRGTDVEEEALISLALLGDGGARRQVLEPYEEAVEESGTAGAFRDRGEVQMRLGNYRRAVRDLEEAIQMLRRRARDTQDELLLLARTYARWGREKDAAEALASAGFSTDELRALARDPDFRALAASPRYGKVFPAE